MFLPLICECLETACKQFVGISLMTDIENNTVARSIKYIMHGDNDIDRTHA